jgi:hypothetical protein
MFSIDITILEVGSWDPAAKEHMMVYDKQLRLYNDIR